MNVIEAKTVRTESRKRIELTDDAIRELLDRAGVEVPFDATVTIQVPGGGDWSNTELDVREGCPVVVSWTEIVEERS